MNRYENADIYTLGKYEERYTANIAVIRRQIDDLKAEHTAYENLLADVREEIKARLKLLMRAVK